MNPASIIAVWVLCSCGAFVLAQSPVTSPAIYTHGRVVSPTNPGEPSWQLPLVCSWPGSAILTYWSGTSITVQIDDLSFWQPEVDGVAQPMFFSTPNQTMSYTFSASAPGLHNFTLTKLTEARFGKATIVSLAPDSSGSFIQPSDTLLPSWVTSGRRIEIFGDSYAIGYGNYVMQSNCSSVQPVYQQTTNPLLSPVPLVARHYGADYHLTAWAASGLTDSLQGSPDLPDFWKRGDATNASSSWNFTSWQPQVVFNAIGSNDIFAYSPDSADMFAQAYVSFSLMVAQVYPTAHYVIVSFSPDTQMFNDPGQSERYTDYMKAAFDAVQNAGLNATFLQLSGVNQSANSCTGHPDYIGDASMAQDMIAAIDGLELW